MSTEILDIHPRELQFPFELKKQMSCSIHLVNNTTSYVAFKVKTTCPKRYCVKPNTGVIFPRSTCDFTVTMQAHRATPTEQLKDKFLVQSTVVPFGTSNENIVSGTFSKESGGYIEETKLKVILVNLPSSPVLQPLNGTLSQDHAEDHFSLETLVLNDEVSYGTGKSSRKIYDNEKPNGELNIVKKSNGNYYGVEKPNRELDGVEKCNGEFDGLEKRNSVKKSNGEWNGVETTNVNWDGMARSNEELVRVEKSELIGVGKPFRGLKDLDNLPLSHVVEASSGSKQELDNLQSKLMEAEARVAKLMKHLDDSFNERSKLQNEVFFLRPKCESRPQEGFPFLFVVFIAIIGPSARSSATGHTREAKKLVICGIEKSRARIEIRIFFSFCFSSFQQLHLPLLPRLSVGGWRCTSCLCWYLFCSLVLL